MNPDNSSYPYFSFSCFNAMLVLALMPVDDTNFHQAVLLKRNTAESAWEIAGGLAPITPEVQQQYTPSEYLVHVLDNFNPVIAALNNGVEPDWYAALAQKFTNNLIVNNNNLVITA